MLATASYPKSAFQGDHDESTQYRPVKDVDSFKALFPQPVEFVEGSSSGALAIPENKYQPINDPSAISQHEEHTTPTAPSTPSTPSAHSKPTKLTPAPPSLYTHEIDMSWPESIRHTAANGLYNTGNTCFLNSALQCLLHIPPLLRIIIAHDTECALARSFCMACELRKTIIQAYAAKGGAFRPSIAGRLNAIAKHMKKGRQEDSHEFLRYAIDALQKSCLVGLPQKIDHKLAETTWVHKLFGGQLRSRVTCGKCGFNSDTYDSILDISLDISNASSLKQAFQNFIGIDHLKGGNKYKCEKCKLLVPAEKQFTINKAPRILTIHLKRFSPLGKKIGHFVHYEQRLDLQPYMSAGEHGPSYSLFGVICHAGGGPNSGHYIAHVKSKGGKWHEMNDDMVSPSQSSALKSAYILFYIQEGHNGTRTQNLDRFSATIPSPSKKRKFRDDEETPLTNGHSKPFIGPLLPSTLTSSSKPNDESHDNDPQASKLRRKIEATKRKASLVDESYGSDEDTGSPVAKTGTSPLDSPTQPPSRPSTLAAISPETFYGTPPTKRKAIDQSSGAKKQAIAGSMKDRYGNPYNRMAASSWNSKGARKKSRPRGI